MLDATAGLQFERIAALQPDLIVGLYAGLTAEEYDQLSAIAPTVAQPGEYVVRGRMLTSLGFVLDSEAPDALGAATSFVTVLSVPFLLDGLVPKLAATLDGDPATPTS